MIDKTERPMNYWRDIYLLHSERKSFKKKVDKSLKIIDEFISIKVKSYVAVSGGKDSTAMAHLIGSVDNSIKIVSQKDDMDFPGEKKFVRNFAKICKMKIKIIEPEENLWDVVGRYDFTEDIHSFGTEFSEKYFYGLLRKYQQENKYRGVFLGLRSEESKGRAMNAKVNRYIYYNLKWKQLICQPLVEWSAADVFAYLFSKNLPILPMYFKTKFVGSPEKIRKSWILPSAQSSQGQALWLKHYYPYEYSRLSTINPKMRCYV